MKKIIVLFSTVVFLFTSAGMSFAKTLKASHQWPGTKNAKTGKYDARHEMVQIIADEVKKANVGYRYSSLSCQSLYTNQESSGNR